MQLTSNGFFFYVKSNLTYRLAMCPENLILFKIFCEADTVQRPVLDQFSDDDFSLVRLPNVGAITQEATVSSKTKQTALIILQIF